jgi:hypothetical protein
MPQRAFLVSITILAIGCSHEATASGASAYDGTYLGMKFETVSNGSGGCHGLTGTPSRMEINNGNIIKNSRTSLGTPDPVTGSVDATGRITARDDYYKSQYFGQINPDGTATLKHDNGSGSNTCTVTEYYKKQN